MLDSITTIQFNKTKKKKKKTPTPFALNQNEARKAFKNKQT